GFFKIKPEEILVVHDELDFPPGTARIKQGGGIAGHNGLKDISQRLATHDYWRLRLGVGKPPAGMEGADYVLQKPPAEERAAIDAAIERSLAVLPMPVGRHPECHAEAAHRRRQKGGTEERAREGKRPQVFAESPVRQEMNLKCGIVGLPNVGKSTLFNALTRAGIAADNYPFCTIEHNVGVVQ